MLYLAELGKFFVMAKIQIGVMGPGDGATSYDLENAFELGKLIAKKGYVTLTGGRPSGVMEAALKGAKKADGETIGILPYNNKSDASEYADIIIVTAMMSARNNINVLSSDVVIACGIEAGTLSEIALALKANKKVIILSQNDKANQFLSELGRGNIDIVDTPEKAINLVEETLQL